MYRIVNFTIRPETELDSRMTTLCLTLYTTTVQFAGSMVKCCQILLLFLVYTVFQKKGRHRTHGRNSVIF